MSVLTSFFVYLLVWWVVLFTVLPLGVRRHSGGKGHDAGAPERADIGKKLVLTTVLSAVVLLVMQVLIWADVIRWHEWFDDGGWR